MAAFVGDYFFPSTLATTVPTAADFYNPPNFVLLPTSAAEPSTHEIDIPTTYSKLITPDFAVTFTEIFRILEQPNRTRTGFENLVLIAADVALNDTTGMVSFMSMFISAAR
jgi:hypothetical protein